MATPFMTAKTGVDWKRGKRGMTATIDGVELECESRWWGNQWRVVGESAFPVPEKLILFISEKGMDHGFWRDLLVGDRPFDDQFFVFCDSPALLPILVGPATRAALVEQGPNGDDIELYVRNGRVTTTGINSKTDTTALDRHLAIHKALGLDHTGFLKSWQQRMSDASGRADLVWPPNATLLRPSGALLVNLTWSVPTSRDGSSWDEAADSLRTEITAHDDRDRKKWSAHEVGPSVVCTHVLADKRFVIVGTLPMPLPMLDSIVGRSEISSIVVLANRITVGVRGIANARQIEGVVRIIQLVVDGTVDSSSPYR